MVFILQKFLTYQVVILREKCRTGHGAYKRGDPGLPLRQRNLKIS